MKIAWIYPFDPKLGNSFYARAYAEALREFVQIEPFDCVECLRDRNLFARINACDLAHLQYEIGFYRGGGWNGFERVCRATSRPKVVTLHEIYREFPGIFPREKIRGRGIVRALREMVYDARHPAHTAFRNHLAHGFWADAHVVHYPYQKQILQDLGVRGNTIEVVEHPIARQPLSRLCFSGIDAGDTEVRLGSSGFINSNYDYEQLFAALDLLKIPWRFTWIGGPRLPEHEPILAEIRERIARRGWEQRFTITGWVDEDALQRHLNDLDVYLALFSNRSTSSTIMKALGSSRLIVARDLPLTRDLNAGASLMMLIVGNDPQDAAARTEELARQQELRNRLTSAVERYVTQHSYGAMAKKLVGLYRKILGQG
jgi:glycosyltransferase involved in cell wall biosynthesis